MMNKQNYRRMVLLTLSVFSLTATVVSARPLNARNPHETQQWSTGSLLSPAPFTFDQITQNVGNIVTTVDNWGYIGGYEYANRPSGEWPRNSGHSYLAEALYWMGAVTTDGDTLVSDSYEDFQAMPMPVNGTDDYRIYLSTDSTRYFDYDPADTTGIGVGRPAQGWRVWNPDSTNFVYNRSFNALQSSFVPSGPTSRQDSHYRFTDNAGGSSLLGLEVTQSILQWNYCYNEDFMFVILDITNTSTQDYSEFAFGLYIDIDAGGPDGSGENGRLGDIVGSDSIENLAWIYDPVKDPGWGVIGGYFGTKLLETPDGIGMTSFRTGDWGFLPQDDPGRFDYINSAQYDSSLPPTDQFYIQCVRGIDLTAGKTVRVVYAFVAGKDEADFRANADLAQELYDQNYVGPEPPTTPTLIARGGDKKIFLSWNDTAEVSVDPLTGEMDFGGYRLYRSDNGGRTWGPVDDENSNECLDVAYTPIFEKSVNAPGDPIQHTFIDSNLSNSVDYWYCLVAYDTGNATLGIDQLQNGFGIAGQTANVIEARPTKNPSGYFPAESTVVHTFTGSAPDSISDGTVIPIVFDKTALQGTDYQIVFQDTPEETYWHIVNAASGDTILRDQTQMGGEEGLFPVTDGMRLVVTNGDRYPRSYVQTGFSGSNPTLEMYDFYGPAIPVFTGDTNDVFGDAPFRSQYEIRYTGDSTWAAWVGEGFTTIDQSMWIPFECWNISTNERVSLAFYEFDEDGVWSAADLLVIVDYPYDGTNNVTADAFPYFYSWMFQFDESTYGPQVGDVFTVAGAPLNGPGDNFAFKVDGVDAADAQAALKKIKVVPNPYFVSFSSMVETAQGETVLTFQPVPERCTIRIYTLTGDLVRTIQHNGGGEARWNLQSENRQQIASGTYFYHVDSPYGTQTGRFAIIK